MHFDSFQYNYVCINIISKLLKLVKKVYLKIWDKEVGELWSTKYVSPPGALSPIGGGKLGGGEIFPAPKSRGPNSDALAYAERASSTYGRST